MRKFDRVSDQIDQNLLQAKRIADQNLVQQLAVNIENQFQALGRGPAADQRFEMAHQQRQAEWVLFKIHAL